jgi:hypothetical protein
MIAPRSKDMTEVQAHQSERAIWTKMQMNAGQRPESIVETKEKERQAGGGGFVWAIGTPPPKALATQLASGASLPIFFSLMLSKPKGHHLEPPTVVRWTSFIDQDGTAKPLPAYMVPTSLLPKRPYHYALICRANETLKIDNLGPFDPKAWRNVGSGRKIGASQVTAFVERHSSDGEARYSIAMQAHLIAWVKLVDPVVQPADNGAFRRGLHNRMARDV